MSKLLFSVFLIVSGLLIGYALQIYHVNGRISLPIEIVALRKILQKIGLLFFMPISFFGAVWIVSFTDMRVVVLPFIGLTVLLSGGLVSLGIAHLLRVRRDQLGVMYCCGAFTNIGAIGGLICYLFLGEAGFAMVALYKMFEEISYYTIGFPIARYYGHSVEKQQSVVNRILGVIKDPFVATVLSAFGLGLILNLFGVPRPIFFEKVTALSVPLGTFVLIVSIGLGMRFTTIRGYFDKSLVIVAVKFVFTPLLGCSLAYMFNLHLIGDGLLFKVVMILSTMPVAFNALVAASVFDLDLDLANSCWLITTGSLIVILPLLYLLLSTLNFYTGKTRYLPIG